MGQVSSDCSNTRCGDSRRDCPHAAQAQSRMERESDLAWPLPLALVHACTHGSLRPRLLLICMHRRDSREDIGRYPSQDKGGPSRTKVVTRQDRLNPLGGRKAVTPGQTDTVHREEERPLPQDRGQRLPPARTARPLPQDRVD